MMRLVWAWGGEDMTEEDVEAWVEDRTIDPAVVPFLVCVAEYEQDWERMSRPPAVVWRIVRRDGS